jgi:hypothetical protein
MECVSCTLLHIVLHYNIFYDNELSVIFLISYMFNELHRVIIIAILKLKKD